MTGQELYEMFTKAHIPGVGENTPEVTFRSSWVNLPEAQRQQWERFAGALDKKMVEDGNEAGQAASWRACWTALNAVVGFPGHRELNKAQSGVQVATSFIRRLALQANYPALTSEECAALSADVFGAPYTTAISEELALLFARADELRMQLKRPADPVATKTRVRLL